jgi:hypothetical protein
MTKMCHKFRHDEILILRKLKPEKHKKNKNLGLKD